MSKRIINCINASIASLYQKAASKLALEEKIKGYLPVHLKDEITVSSYEKGI